jgi:integrase
MIATFGGKKLDSITAPDIERFLDDLLIGNQARARSTVNRYRTLLHAMLNRALRHGRISVNLVQGIAKFKEPEGRIKFLMHDEEAAVRNALRVDLRPLFTVSVHAGMRWSEQIALEWRDVDLLTRLITVKNSKSGYSRQIPMNSAVRAALMDLGAQRQRPQDPGERLFEGCYYTQADKFFPKAVEQAAAAMKVAGQDATRLDGYTWHCKPPHVRKSARHGWR